jgi:hypothetical protein
MHRNQKHFAERDLEGSPRPFFAVCPAHHIIVAGQSATQVCRERKVDDNRGRTVASAGSFWPFSVVTVRVPLSSITILQSALRSPRKNHLPAKLGVGGMQRSKDTGYNSSFDHLVGKRKQSRRDIEAKRLRSL